MQRSTALRPHVDATQAAQDRPIRIRGARVHNLKEIDGGIAGLDVREAHLKDALRLSEELLATGKSGVKEIDLGFSLAELNSASWRTAEVTGALALMEYRQVQALSQLYDFQELFVAENRQTLARLSVALTGMTRDPTKASREDLQAFRHEVLALQGRLLIEAQLAKQLSRSYKSTIAAVFE